MTPLCSRGDGKELSICLLEHSANHYGWCRADFHSMYRRKHHCRACGKIFCDECTCQRLLVPHDQLVYPPANQMHFMEADPCEPQRICFTCSASLLPQQEELRKTMSKASQSNFIDRDSFERYLNLPSLPIQYTMDGEIRKAAYTLYNFTSDNAIEGSDTIPRELIWGAKGLAFLTIVKAGFFFTGRVGTGLVIGRKDDGSWSAPSAIMSSAVGWGFQIGGEVTDLIIVLNSKSALQTFASSAQVSLGTELSVSLGPLGRTAATDVHAGDKGFSAAFSYAHSKGFFVGVSLEAGLLVSRPDVNEAFYGHRYTTTELLMGRVPQPKAGEPLYQALQEVMGDAAYDDDESYQPTGGGGRGHSFPPPPSSLPPITRLPSSPSTTTAYAYGEEEEEEEGCQYYRTPFPTPATYPHSAAAAGRKQGGTRRKRNKQGGLDEYDVVDSSDEGEEDEFGQRTLYGRGPPSPGGHPTYAAAGKKGRGGSSTSLSSLRKETSTEPHEDEWMRERQRRLKQSREYTQPSSSSSSFLPAAAQQQQQQQPQEEYSSSVPSTSSSSSTSMKEMNTIKITGTRNMDDWIKERIDDTEGEEVHPLDTTSTCTTTAAAGGGGRRGGGRGSENAAAARLEAIAGGAAASKGGGRAPPITLNDAMTPAQKAEAILSRAAMPSGRPSLYLSRPTPIPSINNKNNNTTSNTSSSSKQSFSSPPTSPYQQHYGGGGQGGGLSFPPAGGRGGRPPLSPSSLSPRTFHKQRQQREVVEAAEGGGGMERIEEEQALSMSESSCFDGKIEGGAGRGGEVDKQENQGSFPYQQHHQRVVGEYDTIEL